VTRVAQAERGAALAKLTRPRLTRPVLRERLLEQLDRAEEPVAWIAGPPGAGKTTLVASWLAARRLKSLWLQLDTDDREPSTLFHYLGLAAGDLIAKKRARLPVPDAAAAGGDAGWNAFCRRFARALFAEAPEGAVLVFDNTQEIADSRAEQMLALLCEEAPPGCRIAILSRVPPAGAFSLLVARRQLRLVDFGALRFSDEETVELLASLGHGKMPRPDVVQTLSGGWAAGVVLLSAQGPRAAADAGQSFDEDNFPGLFGYFASQVFDSLDPVLKHCLARCSLLERFTGPMAVLMANDTRAIGALRQLAQRHFFVERRLAEGGEEWFQFHPLFRAFLSDQLEAELSAEQLREQRIQSARLLGEAGQVEAAQRMLLSAGEHRKAAAMLLEQAPLWIRQGRHEALIEMLDAIQGAVGAELAWLAFWRGKALVHHDEERARAAFERAYEIHLELGDRIGQLLAAAALAEAITAGWTDFRDIAKWSDCLAQTYDPSLKFPNVELELTVLTGLLAAAISYSGASPLLERAALRARELVEMDADPNQRLAVASLLTNYFDSFGPQDQVVPLIEAVKPLLKTPGITDFRRATWLYWLACYHVQAAELTSRSREHTKASEQCMAEANEIAEAHRFEAILFGVQWVYADAAMRGGDFPKAERLLDDAARWLSPNSPASTTQYYFKRAHLAQRRDDPEQALANIRNAIAAAERANMPERHTSSFYWNEAIALVRLHRFAEAQGSARRAMQSVNPVHADLYRIALLGFEAYEALVLEMGDLGLRLKAFFGAMREKHTFAIFTMLPKELAQLCEAALAQGVEPLFVVELIRARALRPSTQPPESWPWAIAIRALGRFDLAIAGTAFTASGKSQKKPLELLMALTARGEQAFTGVPALQLMDDVWPDLEAEDPKASFDTTLHRLRKLLGVENALLLNDGRLFFNRDLVWTDAAALERETLGIDKRGASFDVNAVAGRLIGLYGGALLDGEEAGWAVTARERLRVRFVNAAGACGRLLEDERAWRDAIHLYEGALAQDNLVEPFYRGLMRAHLELGEKAEGLRAYRRCRELLSIVLSIRPAPETELLHQSLSGLSGK
jgi:LuxR family maltose regulon positive regulatory protein